MKRAFFILLLAAVSLASGYLMSGSTWIGRVGMTFFHKGYNLTKVWWQGAIAVFVVLIALFLVHTIIQQKLPTIAARITHLLLLIAAKAGLYLTYDNFQTDFSHRLLGHSFHYGFYLAWFGWIMTGYYFLFSARKKATPTDQDRMAQAVQ